MRIVSLLPSTTEIACKLGFEDQLVGRSHECDFPESVKKLPVLTQPKYPENGSSKKIDQEVKSLLEKSLSVYRVDADKLAELQPDIILTQDHCKVCAVSLEDVEHALEQKLDGHAKIVSVSPKNLHQIYQSIFDIGDALGARSKAENVVDEIKERMDIIRSTLTNVKPVSAVTIEWIDPLMTAGNWIPECIHIAGGDDLLGTPGEHSPWIEWYTIMNSDPEILLISPCGYSIQQTVNELGTLRQHEGWDSLKAVKNDQVFILDGHHFFNRPGPRIFESTRILAEVFHPAHFKPTLKNTGWINTEELSKAEMTR